MNTGHILRKNNKMYMAKLSMQDKRYEITEIVKHFIDKYRLFKAHFVNSKNDRHCKFCKFRSAHPSTSVFMRIKCLLLGIVRERLVSHETIRPIISLLGARSRNTWSEANYCWQPFVKLPNSYWTLKLRHVYLWDVWNIDTIPGSG